MKNPIKILLIQEGSSKASIMYTGMYHNDKPGFEFIKIYTDIVKEQQGIPTTYDEQKPMTIDNSTPVPVVNKLGNPVMIDNQVIIGYQTKPVEGLDEEGNPVTFEQIDLEKPILENQPYQKTIGEYDKIIWEHFDSRNPQHTVISDAIYDGIVRKVFEAPIPFEFVETAAFKQYFP